MEKEGGLDGESGDEEDDGNGGDDDGGGERGRKAPNCPGPSPPCQTPKITNSAPHIKSFCSDKLMRLTPSLLNNDKVMEIIKPPSRGFQYEGGPLG